MNLKEFTTFTAIFSHARIINKRLFFEVLAPLCIRVEIIQPVHACRDPNDDKFLEVAINGSADFILSGDKDLLVLHPFHD